MWEALLAFHFCIACSLPELLRRPVVERTVRTLAVVFAPPVCQGAPYVVERAENQFAFKHSSRTLPWKLSTCPFCIGLPGWM